MRLCVLCACSGLCVQKYVNCGTNIVLAFMGPYTVLFGNKAPEIDSLWVQKLAIIGTVNFKKL